MGSERIGPPPRRDMSEMFWSLLRLGDVWQVLARSRVAELEFDDLPAALKVFRSEGNDALRVDACARWDSAVRRRDGAAAASQGAKKRTKELVGSSRQALGWMVVSSQLHGSLRAWFVSGLVISGVGGLLGTAGRFFVLRRIIRSMKDGRRAAVTGDALLFAAVTASEGLCAIFSRQIMAGNVAHALVARSNALLCRKAERISSSSAAPSLSNVYSADVPKILGIVKFMSMLPCGGT